MLEDDGGAGCEVGEFYRIVRASYTREELREFIVKSDLAVRIAKIRGLIPWDYDGERDDVQRRTFTHEVQEFDFPDPPRWGEAA